MKSLFDPKTFDPTRIPDSAWTFDGYTSDGQGKKYFYCVDPENGVFVQKTENLVERELLDLNKEEYNESLTKRFGDGQSIARIPLNIFYRDLAPRLKEGDKDYTKWWLNHEDNRPYRKFRGKV